jgi:F0F1-type ATP synthase delta subunit
MNKKLLKQLLLVSYKNGELDNSVVSEIADRLTRSELKIYIRALKNAEKIKNVYVETPFSLSNDLSKDLKDLFPDKRIVFEDNPTLLVGTRITVNDDVYNLSLKNTLDSIIESIENYD